MNVCVCVCVNDMCHRVMCVKGSVGERVRVCVGDELKCSGSG